MPEEKLPTIFEWLSEKIGMQLPSLPQTVKNTDKAIAKVILAFGENLEARIRASTGKAKAQGKIVVADMFRTEEERRKLENRAAATQAAIEELHANPGATDATTEIEDDWLNLFARLVEDKSSDELRLLFGKILAGEIRSPKSFSLRTIQLLSTVSKDELMQVSNFLSFCISGVMPFVEAGGPSTRLQLLMEEIGVAGSPDQIGGMITTFTAPPLGIQICRGTGRGIAVRNGTNNPIAFSVRGQILTASGRELMPIANSPETDLDFLKGVATAIHSELRTKNPAEVQAGLLSTHVVD